MQLLEADSFPILSDEELRVRLLRLRGKRGGNNRNILRLHDVARLARLSTPYSLHTLINGEATGYAGTHHRVLGEKRKRRLSRVLMLIDAGMIEKKEGKYIFHETQQKPMQPIGQVRMGLEGPVLQKRAAERPPDTMPSFINVFNRGKQKLPFVK